MFNNNQGGGLLPNISNIIGNQGFLPSFGNQGNFPNFGGFNIANLVNNLPLNILKPGDNILDLNNDVLVKKIKKSSY